MSGSSTNKSRNDDGADIQCRSQSDLRSAYRPDLLSGHVAVVTGGATGLGFRIAEFFLRHGAKVAIGSRRRHVVQNAVQKLEKATGGSVLGLQLDVRQAESVQKFVSSVVGQWERVDILVNAAAGNFLAPAESLSANAFKNVMDIDANGTFLMSQQVFLQSMKKQGGTIINITATLHWNGELLQVHAGSAKAAIEGMTRHLANEWGRFNVRVNNIAPGPIKDTVGFHKLGGSLGDQVTKSWNGRIALRRLGNSDEVANAALFLASDASSYTTGSTLTVDGGSWFFGGGLVAEHVAKMKNSNASMKSRL